MVGPLVLRDSRGLHDLRNGHWSGENQNTHSIRVKEQNVRLILLVEKNSVFQNLCNDAFPKNNNCLLATAGGFPGRAFLATLRIIHAQLRVPLYVLADNDPAGYELFFLVARGAGSAVRESADLGIPNAFFLGLRAADAVTYGLDDRVQIGMTPAERLALERLQTRSWLAHDEHWQREIDTLLSRGSKVEIEALHTLSHSFLSETYLPERVDVGNHLWLMRS